jgi:diguanylate cyclase (GGDEF)-like protein/PAS domain S-box-containing protein
MSDKDGSNYSNELNAEYFQKSLEALPICAYTCNTDGLITFYNEAATSLWGRSPKLNDSTDRFCGSFKLFSPDGESILHEDCFMAKAIKENKSYTNQKIIIEQPTGKKLTALANANPIHNRKGELIGAVNIIIDITERERAKETLLTIVEGTASVTGMDFFRSMVRLIATALQVKYALVTECIDHEPDRVRSLAFWGNNNFGEMIEYDVEMTPCEKVIKDGCPVYIDSKLQELFPEDNDLVNMGVSSYLGIPIFNSSGVVIGHVALLHEIPIENVLYAESILQLFAERAGAEMARNWAEKKLSYQASHDILTGLVNRREFERRTERLLSTKRQNKEEHALCFMDLDQFKVVNDTCGHVAGDEMLRQLSAELKKLVRHRDTLARLGGDEFGILMEHCPLDDAQRVTKSILEAIQGFQFLWEGHSFKVGVSMGLVPIVDTDTSLSELLKAADAACYIAKDKGRNRVHIYHAEDTEIAKRHGEMQWVERINKALENNQFCLYAQPISSLDSNKSKHYEFLLRMLDDNGSLIPPAAFLPAAERFNQISKIDRWVIENIFDLLLEHPELSNQLDFISINLSGQSLADEDFHVFIIKKIMDTMVPPEKICFEITETAAISNLNIANQFILKMKVLGCLFALDDFGSGLSSFAYLKNLPVDYLKIDGMFVKDIFDDPIDHAMVKSINEIGHVMGMKTIAEFVESDEIKGMLREIGVNYAQGYGIGRPKPLDELFFGNSNNISNISDARSLND